MLEAITCAPNQSVSAIPQDTIKLTVLPNRLGYVVNPDWPPSGANLNFSANFNRARLEGSPDYQQNLKSGTVKVPPLHCFRLTVQMQSTFPDSSKEPSKDELLSFCLLSLEFLNVRCEPNR